MVTENAADVAVRTQIRDWWKDALANKDEVCVADLAREAEASFRLNPRFKDEFVETFLYTVLYESGINMLSERRSVMSSGGEWLSDPGPWLEYNPATGLHISLVNMTPEEAQAAAEFREVRISTELERIEMLKKIASGNEHVRETMKYGRNMTERVRPRIEPDDSWANDPACLVLCPLCGFDYQHHGEVIAFERSGGEDGPTIVSTLGRPGEVVASGNPSPRRNAVRLSFTGECGHEWFLDFVQHKGQTFLFAEIRP